MKIFYFLLVLFLPIFSFSQDFSTYEWEIHNTSNAPFKEDFIVEIIFDKNDVAWVTTSYMELYSYDGKTWEHHPKPEDWELHGWLNEILITPEGKFWITGVVGYLISYNPVIQEWNKIEVPEGQPWVIRQNDKGVILIATSIQTGILYQFYEGKFTIIENRYRDALEILFHKNGNAYVGFRDGFYLIKMNPDGTYNDSDKKLLSKEFFYDLEFDSKGTLWASSFGSFSLFQYKDDVWNKITGAPEMIYFDFNGDWKYIIHELFILPDDRVVFSTQFNASIAIYYNGNWEAYNLPFSAEDGIGRLKLADDLSIWCGTWKHGLNIFKPTKKIDSLIKLPQLSIDFQVLNDGETLHYFGDQTRTIKTAETYTTSSKTVFVEIKDYKKIDADIVSVLYNGKVILDETALARKPLRFELILEEGYNEFLLYAHNLGEIPPNTASIQILDGETGQEVVMNSDFDTCGRILLRKE